MLDRNIKKLPSIELKLHRQQNFLAMEMLKVLLQLSLGVVTCTLSTSMAPELINAKFCVKILCTERLVEGFIKGPLQLV